MVYLTKEEIIQRKKLARYRLKSLVRKALLNESWLSDIDGQLGDDEKKNVAIILSRSYKKGNISLIDKSILQISPQKRTREELKNLEKLFNKMPCFEKFSPLIRGKLARAVEFQYFPKGKTLYQEGHRSLSMYFIIAGEIAVTQLTYDREACEVIDKPIKLLSSADEYFGQIGLIYDELRYASCSTETDCELLVLYKEDFDEILKFTLEVKHENIKSALARFEYFNNYTEAKIKECVSVSRIDQYNPNDIIYSQHDIRNFSFFVLSGKCMILQCLKIKEKENGKSKLVVAKKPTNALELAQSFTKAERISTSITDGDDASIKYQFVDVGKFSVGAVFGIYENMENRVIIAKTTVQCLLIPRNWLFQKSQNIGNVWQRIKLFLNYSIPSQEKLYAEYLKNQKWKKYKRKTIDQILQQYKISDPETQYYNIPMICRIQEK